MITSAITITIPAISFVITPLMLYIAAGVVATIILSVAIYFAVRPTPEVDLEQGQEAPTIDLAQKQKASKLTTQDVVRFIQDQKPTSTALRVIENAINNVKPAVVAPASSSIPTPPPAPSTTLMAGSAVGTAAPTPSLAPPPPPPAPTAAEMTLGKKGTLKEIRAGKRKKADTPSASKPATGPNLMDIIGNGALSGVKLKKAAKTTTSKPTSKPKASYPQDALMDALAQKLATRRTAFDDKQAEKEVANGLRADWS